MLSTRLVACAAIATALLSAPGCSVVLATDEAQCKSDADCAARGDAFAGTICVESTCRDARWGCIGEPQTPLEGMITVQPQFLDLISEQPVGGAVVKLCSQLDPLCNMPLASYTSGVDGSIEVTVAADFLGYLDVQMSGYVPQMIDLDLRAMNKNSDILLMSDGAANGLALQGGVQLDPAKGILVARTIDCQSERTAGVSVSLSPSKGETRFYVLNNVVTKDGTQTDGSGNAGFVNVAVGTPEIRATLGPNGAKIGSAATLVRAGSVTYQMVGPVPPT